MIYLLVVLYVFQGSAHLKQSYFTTAEECEVAGIKEIEKLHPDAHLLVAACGIVDGQEVKGS